uniref:Uncharacterized protein n=1 Tax=Sphaerodactylus townsendi TaxID=933632 RepID=A0ACB8F143_9SAUR
MVSLHHRFEDSFLEEKVRDLLQCLCQGFRSVADYGAEFHQLASCLRNWPECIFIHMFKDGMNPEILQWALMSGDPESLIGWTCLSGDAEAHLTEVQEVGHLIANSVEKQRIQAPAKAPEVPPPKQKCAKKVTKCQPSLKVTLALEEAPLTDEESALETLDTGESSEPSGNDDNLA